MARKTVAELEKANEGLFAEVSQLRERLQTAEYAIKNSIEENKRLRLCIATIQGVIEVGGRP